VSGSNNSTIKYMCLWFPMFS